MKYKVQRMIHNCKHIGFRKERMFHMKRKRIASALVAFLILAFSFTGCNLFHNGGDESSAPVSSSSSSASASSSESSIASQPGSSSSEQTVSSSEVSEPVNSKPSSIHTSSSTDQQVFPIETNDKEFDAYFKKNPLDAAYISASGSAYSNTAMTQLNEKYQKYWQGEIDSAYQRLLAKANSADKTSFKAEQLQWVNETPAALKKISKDVLAAGGAAPQVDVSSKIMEYYRTRAAQVYKDLYGYDKNYSYAFSK